MNTPPTTPATLFMAIAFYFARILYQTLPSTFSGLHLYSLPHQTTTFLGLSTSKPFQILSVHVTPSPHQSGSNYIQSAWKNICIHQHLMFRAPLNQYSLNHQKGSGKSHLFVQMLDTRYRASVYSNRAFVTIHLSVLITLLQNSRRVFKTCNRQLQVTAE